MQFPSLPTGPHKVFSPGDGVQTGGAADPGVDSTDVAEDDDAAEDDAATSPL